MQIEISARQNNATGVTLYRASALKGLPLNEKIIHEPGESAFDFLSSFVP